MTIVTLRGSEKYLCFDDDFFADLTSVRVRFIKCKMTRLVAVSVALAWATNVHAMLNDAKHFKKGIEFMRKQNVVALRGCEKFSSVGDSQLTVLMIQKNQYSCRKTVYSMFSKKETFGLRN